MLEQPVVDWLVVDPFVALAFVLLVVGIVGSVVPLLPGPAVSLAGVLVYWHASGYVAPGPFVLAALVLVLLATIAFDLVAGALSAKIGGASNRTTIAAGVVGVLLMLVAGPVGLVLGLFGTVFALEYYENDDPEASARAAAYATVGLFASAIVQVLVTATVLATIVLVHLW